MLRNDRCMKVSTPAIEEAIESAGIRPSPVRNLVYRTLMDSGRPVSGQDIELALESVDRSSITRTLAIFAGKGLVHTVDDGSGAMKYELCRSCGQHDRHNDTHPHFHCTRCGHTFCFEDMEIPPVPLPKGFTANSSNYVIKGICPECNGYQD